MSKELFEALEEAQTAQSGTPMLDEIAGFLLATHHTNWSKKGQLSAVHAATAICGCTMLRNRMSQSSVLAFDAAIQEARTILAGEIAGPQKTFAQKIVTAFINEGV